jgi:hypothetical protein
MNAQPCKAPLATETIVAYWLSELGAAAETDVEEHLFACGECTTRANSVAELGRAIRDATGKGALRAILPGAFVEQLSGQLIVRKYRLQPGESVLCTVAPRDDLVVAYLNVPLMGVQRLDVVLEDLNADDRQRLEDVAFDPSSDEIVLATNVAWLRQLDLSTHRVQLRAVEPGGERVLGEYTFNHSPYRPDAHL